MKIDHVLQGDCRETLKQLPDNSVDCCVTSPPYFNVRDYGTGTWIGGDPNCDHVANKHATKKFGNDEFNENRPSREETKTKGYFMDICPKCGAVREDYQIGLEDTPEEYIVKLVDVFGEVKRVLKDDGTLWLNIGDTYNSTPTGSVKSAKQKTSVGSLDTIRTKKLLKNLKPKDLIGIPWMLAFALREDGWFLRQDIIWHKQNPMPESVKDRCTKSHEYMFLFSKSQKYYFDYQAIQEDSVCKDDKRLGGVELPMMANERKGGVKNTLAQQSFVTINEKRNKRDVWTVNTKPIKDAHFATFPEELIEPCILAGCPVGGVVLDPFFGSGTTGRVATKLNRHYIGCELNPEYIEISDKRTNNIQMSLTGLI